MTGCLTKKQCHDSKVKHLIWNDLVLYTTVAWESAVKFAIVSAFLAEGLFQGFDETWGVRNALCRFDNLIIAWN